MTWLPLERSDTNNDLDALLALNPQAGKTLIDFLKISDQVNNSELLALCRLRMAQLMHCRADLANADAKQLATLDNWNKSDEISNTQKAALDFTEQFIIGANNITPLQRQKLADALGVPEPSTFVYGLYISEAMVRFLTFFDVSPQPQPDVNGTTSVGEKSDRKFIEWVDNGSNTDPELLAAYYAFNLATCSLHGIDELTDEIVRLRSAEYHDCKFCQSVRRVVDKPSGVDDLMGEVRDYQSSTGLTSQQKVALDVLDVFLVSPSAVSDELKANINQQFSAQHIVELIMKEMFWMSNKPMISLGTDPGAVSKTNLTDFEYDAKGNFVLL
jgi:alkylhydroperoxidase family enzyme